MQCVCKLTVCAKGSTEMRKDMIDLGRVQKLKVIREKEFGVYLGQNENESGVLLPGKQVPEGTALGDELDVFVYKDSNDRLICTTRVPAVQVGELAVLEVVQKSKIGAFLNWGLEKDLFLPFKEQSYPVNKGDKCLVALYIDKSKRLCATMRIYDYLRADSPFREEDTVSGIIYRINPDYGAFVAVDNRYYGLIPSSEIFEELKPGDRITAKVARVRQDGKLDLRLRERAYLQMEEDAQVILNALEEFDGVLPFGEKASPEVIKRELHLSKNSFKRALGRLLKEGKIQISETSVRKL